MLQIGQNVKKKRGENEEKEKRERKRERRKRREWEDPPSLPLPLAFAASAVGPGKAPSLLPPQFFSSSSLSLSLSPHSVMFITEKRRKVKHEKKKKTRPS